MHRMSWTWQYEDVDGAPLSKPARREFSNKSDAESWLGESWRELLDAGVHQVSLFEEDRVEYGPMGLTAE